MRAITAGSQSMQNSATAIRHAAAQVREILIAEAAQPLRRAPRPSCTAAASAIVGAGGRSLSYGELVAGQTPACRGAAAIPAEATRAASASWASPLPRVDIPRQSDRRRRLCARSAARRHGACARRAAAELRRAACEGRHRRRRGACPAWSRSCATATSWPWSPRASSRRSWRCARSPPPRTGRRRPTLPDQAQPYRALQSMPAQDGVVAEAGDAAPRRRARRSRPPSPGPTRSTAPSARPAPSPCSRTARMTVWSHTQGVYPDREAIAEMLAHAAREGPRHPHGGLGLLRP